MTVYYKFLGGGRIATNSGYQWPEIGEWTPAVKGALVACENGYHLCRPQDLSYWIDAELWEAEVKGNVVESDNKIVARAARLVRRIDAWNERTRRLFACDCAERALGTVGNPDQRSVQAVRVARLYATGEASREQLAAAWDAAWAAAMDDARAASWAASWAAAMDDARAASWAASWAAAMAWQSERIVYYIGGRS